MAILSLTLFLLGSCLGEGAVVDADILKLPDDGINAGTARFRSSTLLLRRVKAGRTGGTDMGRGGGGASSSGGRVEGMGGGVSSLFGGSVQ